MIISNGLLITLIKYKLSRDLYDKPTIVKICCVKGTRPQKKYQKAKKSGIEILKMW